MTVAALLASSFAVLEVTDGRELAPRRQIKTVTSSKREKSSRTSSLNLINSAACPLSQSAMMVRDETSRLTEAGRTQRAKVQRGVMIYIR